MRLCIFFLCYLSKLELQLIFWDYFLLEYTEKHLKSFFFLLVFDYFLLIFSTNKRILESLL